LRGKRCLAPSRLCGIISGKINDLMTSNLLMIRSSRCCIMFKIWLSKMSIVKNEAPTKSWTLVITRLLFVPTKAPSAPDYFHTSHKMDLKVQYKLRTMFWIQVEETWMIFSNNRSCTDQPGQQSQIILLAECIAPIADSDTRVMCSRFQRSS